MPAIPVTNSPSTRGTVRRCTLNAFNNMDLARSIAALFSRCGRCFSRSAERELNPAHRLGQQGEKLAARFLRRNGCKVLYRNFRAPHGGEVDLICRDRKRKTLVFVEVKTRRNLDLGHPSEAVNAAKQRLISRGALAWLRLLGHPDIHYRFDIVEVIVSDEGVEINLIENAFTLSEPYR